MSTDEVNQILIAMAALRGEVTTLRAENAQQFANLTSENVRGEGVHQDHEIRLRNIETTQSQQAGAWKLLTAGGAIGALIVAALAVALRSIGF